MPTLKMTTAGKRRAKSDKRGGEDIHRNREKESREAETGSIHGQTHILSVEMDQKDKDFTIYHTSQKTNDHGKGTKIHASTYTSRESSKTTSSR